MFFWCPQQDLMGRTPLHWACSRNLLKTASLLLDKGVAILKTNGQETALHWASSRDNTEMICLLLKYHPELQIYDTNDRGETAIDLAKSNDTKQLLEGMAESLNQKHKVNPKNIIHNEPIIVSVKPLESKAKPKKLTIKLKSKTQSSDTVETLTPSVNVKATDDNKTPSK
jgi:ankyrin repeat protein